LIDYNGDGKRIAIRPHTQYPLEKPHPFVFLPVCTLKNKARLLGPLILYRPTRHGCLENRTERSEYLDIQVGAPLMASKRLLETQRRTEGDPRRSDSIV
jgi:hypothetical protein